MNNDVVYIRICQDYSDTPGGRYIKEGKYSGEDFRETILFPKYKEAIEQQKRLIVDFDGCFGFGTSFLEEAFGGMAREHHVKGFEEILDIKSTEDETIPDNVHKYITEAEEKIK